MPVYPEKTLEDLWEPDDRKRCGALWKSHRGVIYVCDQTKGHDPEEPHRAHALRRIWIACWGDEATGTVKAKRRKRKR
jgi:hypothetical protein